MRRPRELFGALLLGGTTLTIYKDTLLDEEPEKRNKIAKKLRESLIRYAGFEKNCATLLSEELHRLKPNSIKLLESEEKSIAEQILFSFVTDFDFVKEFKIFRNYVNTASAGMPQAKMDLFRDGIFTANTNAQTLTLKELCECIKEMLGLRKVGPAIKAQLAN